MYTHIHYMCQTDSSGKRLQDSRELSPGLWDDLGGGDAGSGKEAREGEAMCILKRFTLLYSRNPHNTAKQLSSN